METKEIAERNKEMLQSEEWNKVRQAIREKVEHFTAEMEPHKSYGNTWQQVVLEYLRTGHKAEQIKQEVNVYGKTYKVLKRGKVTAFYDADGNPLFDVENVRLDREYEYACACLDKNDPSQALDAEKEGNAAGDGKIQESVQKVEESKEEKPEYTGIDGAITKLKTELKKAEDKAFAEPVIGYLIKRCGESESLASDVCQGLKTWEKCLEYIYSQAKKQAKEQYAFVRDEAVYEWAEDYFHKDDKAEEEKKAKEKAERKARQNKKSDGKMEKKNPAREASVTRKNESRTKKSSKDIEGQLDIFAMMEM